LLLELYYCGLLFLPHCVIWKENLFASQLIFSCTRVPKNQILERARNLKKETWNGLSCTIFGFLTKKEFSLFVSALCSCLVFFSFSFVFSRIRSAGYLVRELFLMSSLFFCVYFRNSFFFARKENFFRNFFWTLDYYYDFWLSYVNEHIYLTDRILMCTLYSSFSFISPYHPFSYVRFLEKRNVYLTNWHLYIFVFSRHIYVLREY